MGSEKSLQVDNLSIGYGPVPVFSNISFSVPSGEIVAVIGPNGHGKTTLMRGIAGLRMPTAGSIRFEDELIQGLPTHERVKRGIILMPEGTGYVSSFSVLENLKLGAYVTPQDFGKNLRRVYDLFPWLRSRNAQVARTLSGGERRMLAIARCLMANPTILLLDEPTLGVAPVVQNELRKLILEISHLNCSLIITESNVAFVKELTEKMMLLKNGEIKMLDPRVITDNVSQMFL